MQFNQLTAIIIAKPAQCRRPIVKQSNQVISSKILRQLVLPQLGRRCRQSISELFTELNGQIVGEFGKQYAFKDNGAKILAVAHCDTVRHDKHFEIVKLSDETIIFSAQLDDRLGLYTILDLLPRLGIRVDVLLTENEEIGESTAKDFVTDKQYNWIVEFDRNGETAVTYQFDEFIKAVSRYFKFDIGTYSDIAELDFLGCSAVNIGVGYHGEHTGRCHLDVNEYVRQIVRFLRFYKGESERHYPHSPLDIELDDMPEYPSELCNSCGAFVQGHLYDEKVGRYLCEECGTPLSCRPDGEFRY
jgi:hypothetical protein